MTTVWGHLTKKWRSGLLLTAVVAVAAACGGGGSAQSADCDAPTPVETGDDAQVPLDLDLTDFGTLTRLEVDGGFTSYRVEGKGSVQDTYVPVTRQIRDDGWNLVGSENEGVDAEVYFARGTSETGVVLLQELDCAGTIAIEVTVNSPKAQD